VRLRSGEGERGASGAIIHELLQTSYGALRGGAGMNLDTQFGTGFVATFQLNGSAWGNPTDPWDDIPPSDELVATLAHMRSNMHRVDVAPLQR
jgi:hypothetical protein